MTFGSNMRKPKYPLSTMEVGEVYAHEATTKEEQRRVRRAAHNRNARSKKYFITRCKGDILYITRVR